MYINSSMHFDANRAINIFNYSVDLGRNNF